MIVAASHSSFALDPGSLASVAVSAVAMLVWAIVVIRVVGLRSLAKISSFDFVVTVALGSITATTVVTTTSLWQGVVAFAVLLGAQWVIARLRRVSRFAHLVDNRPALLVEWGRIDQRMMDRCRITRDDLLEKLRAAGVTHLAEVAAVVLEKTGDVSVMTGAESIDPFLLSDVRRTTPQDDPTRDTAD